MIKLTISSLFINSKLAFLLIFIVQIFIFSILMSSFQIFLNKNNILNNKLFSFLFDDILISFNVIFHWLDTHVKYNVIIDSRKLKAANIIEKILNKLFSIFYFLIIKLLPQNFLPKLQTIYLLLTIISKNKKI